MWSRKVLYLALGVLISGSPGIYASDYEREDYYERRGPIPFEVMDLNGDGIITAEEHEKVHAERQKLRAEQGYPMRRAASAPKFEQFDLNDNGSIDSGELSAWRAQRWQQRGPGCGGRWKS